MGHRCGVTQQPDWQTPLHPAAQTSGTALLIVRCFTRHVICCTGHSQSHIVVTDEVHVDVYETKMQHVITKVEWSALDRHFQSVKSQVNNYAS